MRTVDVDDIESGTDVSEQGVPAEEPSAKAGPRSRRAFLAVAVVLTLALVGLNAYFWLWRPSADDLDGVRSDAMSSAKAELPKVLGYSYRTIDADIATASDQLTGAFKKDYTALLRSKVRPASVAGRITTHAAIADIGVVSASRDSVVVLAFVDLTTTSGKGRTPQINGSRVEVTMRHVDDKWLIAGINPV